jgi:predicted acyl esterase
MKTAPVGTKAKVSYEGAIEEVCFDYRFEEDTEITGYLKLRLWVEAEGHDDMDLFINVQKLSTKGDWLPITIFGENHPGAWGKLRVSRRKLDEKLSTDFEPVQAHTCDEKLAPGEIVPVDIAIWPTSRIWHKGQQIRVQIAGRYIREDWFEPLQWEADNHGKHIIHTGGNYDSFLQIPVIPPKYQDGDYIYR